MAAKLNHTIVHAHDKNVSAAFLSEILGLPPPVPFGPFMGVRTDNDVTLDFIDAGDMKITPEHYAFFVSDAEFDEIFSRIKGRKLPYWADPHKQQRGEINHWNGGRGVYFEDPDGHFLEILTRPYSGG